MANDFNPQALGAFANVNFGNNNAIVNIGDGNALKQKGKLRCFLFRTFRGGNTEKRNNAVRTELLKALGQAFGLEGMSKRGDKTIFSDAFMDSLERILGF